MVQIEGIVQLTIQLVHPHSFGIKPNPVSTTVNNMVFNFVHVTQDDTNHIELVKESNPQLVVIVDKQCLFGKKVKESGRLGFQTRSSKGQGCTVCDTLVKFLIAQYTPEPVKPSKKTNKPVEINEPRSNNTTNMGNDSSRIMGMGVGGHANSVDGDATDDDTDQAVDWHDYLDIRTTSSTYDQECHLVLYNGEEVELELGDLENIPEERLSTTVASRLRRRFPAPLKRREKWYQKLLRVMWEHQDWNRPTEPFLINYSMGSGKTFAWCNLLNYNPPESATVICGLSLMKQWKTTISSYAAKVPGRPTYYRILGYDQLVAQVKEDPDYLSHSILAVDESHVYRNITPAMVKPLQAIEAAPHVFLITGTALVNDLEDKLGLDTMMRLRPVKVPSEEEKAEYAALARNPTRMKQVLEQMLKEYKGRVSFYDPRLSGTPKEVERGLSLFPTVHRHDIEVPMTWAQTLHYVLDEFQSVTIGGIQISSSKRNAYMSSTRAICNAYEVSSKDAYDFVHQTPGSTQKKYFRSPKFSKIVDVMLEQLRPEVVFSRYLDNGLFGVRQILEKRAPSWSTAKWTGNESSRVRGELLQQFNSKKIDALFISPSGKQGVDLQGAMAMHLCELADNMQDERQTENRVVRLGSHDDEDVKEVQMFRYISTFPVTSPTVEDLVELESVWNLKTGGHARDVSVNEVYAELTVLVASKRTADELLRDANIKKQLVLDPFLLVLQCSSIGDTPTALKKKLSLLLEEAKPPQKGKSRDTSKSKSKNKTKSSGDDGNTEDRNTKRSRQQGSRSKSKSKSKGASKSKSKSKKNQYLVNLYQYQK